MVPKTEAAYRATVDRLLVQMRERNELPDYWITDNGRWMRKPSTNSSLESMLYHSQLSIMCEYVEALWFESDCEKFIAGLPDKTMLGFSGQLNNLADFEESLGMANG